MNTALVRGMGQSGDGQYNAISYTGSNSVILNNVIKNTGYLGIHFSGDNVLIKNNLVDTFCMVKSDGGGIYTYAETDKVNRRVISNIVLNALGDPYGLEPEVAPSYLQTSTLKATVTSPITVTRTMMAA